MIKFFLTHTCNEYCLALNLIHPKNFEKDLNNYFDFFVNKIKIPTILNKPRYKCCDLCKEPAVFSEQFLHSMKIAGKECFCNTCLENIKNTKIKIECNICKKEFVGSVYGFKLKRMELPEYCPGCRKENRKRLEISKNYNLEYIELKLKNTNILSNENNLILVENEDKILYELKDSDNSNDDLNK